MNENKRIISKENIYNSYDILNLDQPNKGLSHAENFVIDILDQKRNGYYVELGAYHSKIISNTYNLENIYGWKGVSFEISPKLHAEITEIGRAHV